MEEVVRVVWSRRRLRMVLDGEDRQLPVTHALRCSVVQVDVGLFEPSVRHGLRIDGEPMVLRRDPHVPAQEIPYRVVRAVVPELELVGRAAECEPEDLVAETDPEDWRPAD